MSRLITFPYKHYLKDLYPIIKIHVKGPKGILKTEAFVDSGASKSIFMTEFAVQLGIDTTKGEAGYTLVGDGDYIPVFTHQVPVQIGHIWVMTTLSFSSQLGADFHLLGQQDIFDNFIITINRPGRLITFQYKPQR